ncbi:MAG: TlpA disulfide reductase family protein [Thermodesulfobacteriota bacterium]
MKPICHTLLPSRALIAIVTLALMPTGSAGADPISDANIFVYPKPLKVAELVFGNQQGGSVSLKEYTGRVVLLHFWSINCPACRMEEPLLHDLKRAFGGNGLEILGVNLVDPPQAAVSHAARNRFPFPVLVAQQSGFSLQTVSLGTRQTSFLVNPMKEAILEVPGFPTTYIIDCRGSAVAYSVGVARWDQSAARGFVQRLVTEAKTCAGPIRVGAAAPRR